MAVSRIQRTRELLSSGISSKEARKIIQEEFGISINAANSYISRARRLLRETPDPEQQHANDKPPEPEFAGYEYDKFHFYNALDDVYIVWLPGLKGRTKVLRGEDVREAKRMYSRWEESGPEKTLNQVAQKFGWSRKFFVDLKTELGWTHDQDPFTDEEVEDKEVDELYDDLVMMKREELERKRNLENWKETIADAKRWREFNELTLEPLLKKVEGGPASGVTLPVYPAESLSDLLAVVAPFDAHVDVLGYDNWGHEEAREAILETNKKLAYEVSHKGPTSVDLALGSDWWTCDNMQGQTSRGTPQDISINSNDGLIFGLDLMMELISIWINVGPLVLRMVPGNHDERSCVAAWWALRQIYRDTPSVKVVDSYDRFQYRLWGSNLLGWHHGDLKGGETNYYKCMTNKVPGMWGKSMRRYQFVGHLHHLYQKDIGGIQIIQQPSIAHHDTFHHRGGYWAHSDAGQAVHLLHKDEGLNRTVYQWI